MKRIDNQEKKGPEKTDQGGGSSSENKNEEPKKDQKTQAASSEETVPCIFCECPNPRGFMCACQG